MIPQIERAQTVEPVVARPPVWRTSSNACAGALGAMLVIGAVLGEAGVGVGLFGGVLVAFAVLQGGFGWQLRVDADGIHQTERRRRSLMWDQVRIEADPAGRAPMLVHDGDVSNSIVVSTTEWRAGGRGSIDAAVRRWAEATGTAVVESPEPARRVRRARRTTWSVIGVALVVVTLSMIVAVVST